MVEGLDNEEFSSNTSARDREDISGVGTSAPKEDLWVDDDFSVGAPVTQDPADSSAEVVDDQIQVSS